MSDASGPHTEDTRRYPRLFLRFQCIVVKPCTGCGSAVSIWVLPPPQLVEALRYTLPVRPASRRTTFETSSHRFRLEWVRETNAAKPS